MANTLQVKVSSRREGQNEWYEGTVSISGVKPTKLCRKSDGSTRFATRSSLTGAARNLAQSLGYNGVDFGTPAIQSQQKTKSKPSPKTTTSSSQTQVSQTQVKVAAKKAVLKKN